MAILYAFFGGIWIVGSDWLLQAIAGPRVAALIAPQTGVVFIFVTAGLLFVLVRQLQAGATPSLEQPEPLLKSGLTLRMLLVTVMALVPVVGMVAYSFFDQRERALIEAHARLSRVVDSARDEAQELLASARVFLLAISRADAVRDLDSRRCATYLRDLKEGLPQYVNFGIIRPDGTSVCSALPASGPVDLSDRSYFRDAMERRAFSVGDYQEGRISKRTSLNVGYPMFGADGMIEAVAFAALDLDFFASHVDRVAISGDAVSMLIDRQGRVLFRRPDAGIRIDAVDPNAPVTAASRESATRPRVLPGLDGVLRVYAFARVQPEESGLVVAVGIPVAEVMAPIQTQLAHTVARMLVALVIALIGAWFLGWFGVVKPASAVVRAARRVAGGDFSVRTGAAGFGGELGDIGRAFDDMAQSLERSETRYRATFEQAALGIAHLSCDGKFLRVNQRLCQMLGYSVEEFLVLDFQRIAHPEDVAIGYGLVRRVLAGAEGEHAVEQRQLRKDGSVVWCRLTLSMVRTPAGEPDYFITVVDDISDKKWAERRIERLAAMYRTLSETNEAIARREALPALQQEICDIVAKFGGFTLAWVGTVDRRGGLLRVSAQAGGAVGADLYLPLDEGVAEGRGPSVQAALRGAHVICNNFLNDPATAPWHLWGNRHGIAASAAFPLRQGGRVEGVLNV
ncbi:MAG TPA: PAS domain S-box protein, partial [Burkholderiales bacterium]